PGVLGQCVDCNKIYEFHCLVNRTGYFCETGAVIHTIKTSPLDYRPKLVETLADACTPKEFNVEHVETLCCFFSPELGCQLFMNPAMMAYENRPIARCMDCSKHCSCMNSGGSIPFQSWTIVCTLGSLAL
ncbi:hypothetical protein KR038_008346, partial [Drosophila bunnanda]